jgi:hypothetical protein
MVFAPPDGWPRFLVPCPGGTSRLISTADVHPRTNCIDVIIPRCDVIPLDLKKTKERINYIAHINWEYAVKAW